MVITVTVHGAAIALTHPAWSGGRASSSPVNWVALLSVITSMVMIFLVGITVASLRRPHRRGDGDDTDFRGGSGGRGPDAPRRPEGDPSWWPEFEQEFAAHVADSRRPTTRV